jgi:hypothetical protein
MLIWFDKPIINRTGQSGRQPFSTDINFHLIFQTIGSSTKALTKVPGVPPAKNARGAAKNRWIVLRLTALPAHWLTQIP